MTGRRLLTTAIALVAAIAIITLSVVTPAKSDGNYQLYVLRPKISLYANRGSSRIMYLPFGTQLKLLVNEYDWCKVETPEGEIGYVSTGFIGYGYDMIWLDKGANGDGVCLSPAPGMSPTQFAYAAGGQRMSERAIVLVEDGRYYYIVTEEGFSGYVLKYEPNIQSYEYHVWLELQEQQQEVEGDG